MRPAIVILCLLCWLPTPARGQKQASVLVTLEQCLSTVIGRSGELAEARAEAAQKKALLQSTRKDLLPTLSTYYSFVHQPDTKAYSDYDNEFSYGITLEQTLFDGMATFSRIDQADLAWRAAVQDIRATLDSIIFTTYREYFDLLRAEKLLDAARDTVARLQAHHDDAAAMFARGMVSRNVLLQSDVELSRAHQEFIDAQDRVDLARSRLNLAMGRRLDAALRVADWHQEKDALPSWQEILSATLHNRPEIRQAELAVRLAEKDITLKKSPFMPQVTLSASYGRLGDEPGGSPATGDPDQDRSVKAMFSWKFWSWLKDSDEKTAALQAVIRARSKKKHLIDQVTLEARKAFLNLRRARKQIRATEKGITHAQENFRISRSRFRAQAATATEVIDAQALFSQAVSRNYEALYDLRIAWAQLLRVQGKLAEKMLFHPLRKDAPPSSKPQATQPEPSLPSPKSLPVLHFQPLRITAAFQHTQ